MEDKNKEQLSVFSQIAEVIEKDSSMIIKNPVLGDVIFANGTLGNLEKKNTGGFGIKHIIDGRYRKDGLNEKEVSALLYLIKDTVETVIPDDITKNRLNIRKNSIFVGVSKQWLGSDENWVITGFAENDENNVIKKEAADAVRELLTQAKLEEGDILVVGCSSSEVVGERIGTFSSVETAEAVFDGIYEVTKQKGIYLAAQCCEHLNRALIVEKELMKRDRLTRVNVVPQPKAGGSFGTTAYKRFKDSVAVEHISAQAGMDIGDTLIGMHLQAVAVPVRIAINRIGSAHVVCARTRAKFVGGSRAVYDEELL